ncbi:MAG: hypothetical protein P9M06_03630 [Candidatus Saelkia tenebricola]|nr:hypothetical protein [Candidatus Saelkia tenebricola]
MKKLIVFFLFLTFQSNFITSSLETQSTRRVITPQTDESSPPVLEVVTERWITFLQSALKEAIEESLGNNNINHIPDIEKGISDTVLFHIRNNQPITTSLDAKTIIKHIWNMLGWGYATEEEIGHILLKLDGIFSIYKFLDFFSHQGETTIKYTLKVQEHGLSIIDEYDIEEEQILLQMQRSYPLDSNIYSMLKTFYEQMIEKYPNRSYYNWQLSWALSALGNENLRTHYFTSGLQKEYQPIPDYISKQAISTALKQHRENADISWGYYPSDKNIDYSNVRFNHAIKYCMQFPEIFMPQGNPIDLSSSKFNQAITRYGNQARDIIRAPSGTEIYGFCRDDILIFTALRPETGEVVGFRMKRTLDMNTGRDVFEIVIDTFYKINPEMVRHMQESSNLTLFIDSSGENPGLYDAYPDPYRNARKTEAETERDYFALTPEMYQEAIDAIRENILPHSDKISAIVLAGLTSAGKSPCTEEILKFLDEQGIPLFKSQNFITPTTNRRVISLPMDSYYLNRNLMPTRNDRIDFDNPLALDVNKFRTDLAKLLRGEQIELPHYDFESGISNPNSGIYMQLNPGDILLIEGIHALNPLFTDSINHNTPNIKMFITASEVLRLARRTVRDSISRGYPPIETLKQWLRVVEAEHQYIHPTAENEDVLVINTDLTVEVDGDTVPIYQAFEEGIFTKYALYLLENRENEKLDNFNPLYTTFLDDLELAYTQALIKEDIQMAEVALHHIKYYYGNESLLALYEDLLIEGALELSVTTIADFLEIYCGIQVQP